MHTLDMKRDPLVQTRLPEKKIAALAVLAKRNERTVAAELRVAIDKHLASQEGQHE